MKQITINATKEDFIPKYVALWNGILELTQGEQAVLCELLRKYQQLYNDKLRGSYLDSILFSTTYRKDMQHNLGYTYQNFNNYFKSLKDKQIILKMEEGYQLSTKVIPNQQITFTFLLQ